MTRSPRQAVPVAHRTGSLTLPEEALTPSPFQSYCRVSEVEVGPLAPEAIATALDRGAATARQLRHAGRITSAVLLLRGEFRVVA